MSIFKFHLFWVTTRLAFLSCVCHAYPSLLDSIHERQISAGELAAAYDYIVVGGGQSGLVIANRLSEDTGKTVLIVEYGYLDNTPSQVEPSSSFQYPTRDMFNVTTVAQPGINNARSSVYAASVVGGGSTINGMLFDRGSAEDYDNWAKLGNTGWDWAGLYPYFKKSTTFTPPAADLAAQYNITWDTAAYGSGPINATYPPWVWPTTKVQFAAWHDVGVATPKEAAAGMSYGSFWVPSNVDPVKITRSYARNGYWDPAASRTNLKLLTGYRVNEVQFDANKRAQSVTVQQRGTANGAATITVKANQEIILCAGWLHTPQILQRSGVGPKSLLTSAGINVLVDLPGVGSNLQDHPAGSVSFTYQKDLTPNQGSYQTNATFATWAQQQWLQRKGPQSVGVGNSMATIPLAIFHPGYQTTIAKAQAQNAATYLPNTYTAENIAGYQAQRDILLKSMASLTNGHIEIPFSGGASNSLCLEKPLSRGTIRMSTTDKYAEPSVDYNTNINPVDSDIFVAAVKFYRKWMASPSMAQLSPVEQSPGTSVTSDAALASFASTGMGSSTAHSCCTSPMMPKAMGGVIGPDLLVYGVTGLSVGDISMIPLIPATHTCATVYAIAEKAADIIKARAISNPNPGSSSSTSLIGSSTSTSSTSLTSITQSSTTTSVPPVTTTTGSPVPVQTHWGQCGGQDWKGATTCESPYTCKYSNPYYSQCL